MKIVHRYNSKERQHYLPEKQYTFKFKPRLLYAGFLEKRPGWREDPHTHDFVELVFVTEGRGTVTVEGQTVPIERGDMLVYNAGVTHYEVGDREYPLELRCVAYDKVEMTDLPKNWLLPPNYGWRFPSGEMYDLFRERFNAILQEFEERDQLYSEVVQNEGRVLLMYLFRLIGHSRIARDLAGDHPAVQQAKAYMDAHYPEPLLLDTIADACRTNKYYLAHLFSRIEGVSMGKYLLSRRLAEACRLLRESALPIGRVAEAVGFHDVSYFCRIFKKEQGVSPSAYRKSGQ